MGWSEGQFRGKSPRFSWAVICHPNGQAEIPENSGAGRLEVALHEVSHQNLLLAFV